ncbi:MAG: ATP-dependent helicase [Candidatus Omnitrophota bacterium]
MSTMSMPIHYEKSLNKQQLQAVYSLKGPHLVLAGAGSGKTRVLVYRTAYLVDQGVEPRHILLLTFTRRAANEMLSRATNILDDRCLNVSGGTFHSFANSILRQYGGHIGLPGNFTILDESDAESIINRLRAGHKLNKIEKKFPKKNTVYAIISKSVNKCTDIATVVYDEFPQFIEWIDVIEQIGREYADAKRNSNTMDFDDLLLMLRDLLQRKEEIRQILSDRYQFIMVDEYQDTNKIQADVVRLLASTHDNVMVVGDDSQSIYSFRGAHFKNIIDFPRTFSGTKIIKLEENYRSSQPILDLTNEVILFAKEKFDKRLFTRQKGSQRPVYRDVLNENAQSKYIVQKIGELRGEGISLKDIAVLFRSGWHSNDLEIELSSWGIPFVKFGGYKFVESAHVKDVLSYLRLLQNHVDATSWIRILTLIPGIGEKTAVMIADDISKSGGINIQGKYLKKNPAMGQLAELLKSLDPETQSLTEILDKVLQFYYPLLMLQYDDYDKRINDLESLQKIVERYPLLNDFLTDLTLDPPEKSMMNAASRKHETLTLSTIHSAKGLEWEAVFLIHLCDGQMPSYKAMDNQDALEEERRLFYVAATRAKRHLFFLRPQMLQGRALASSNQINPYTRVSRFLGEGRILESLVDIEHRYGSGSSLSLLKKGDGGASRDDFSDYFDRTNDAWDN